MGAGTVEVAGGKRTEKKGISGSTLKMVAIIAMALDHVGAVVLARVLLKGGNGLVGLTQVDMGVFRIYFALRLIGRLGFPIFCYLLIEGFQHTRNVKRYAGRLFLFALASEIPFDLGFSGDLFYLGYQNVFFTLLIGLLVIAGFRYAQGKQWNQALRIIFCLGVLSTGTLTAMYLRTDYGAVGVITIAAMYLCRKNKMLEAGVGCVALTVMQFIEVTSFFILIPIKMYNGKRGWNMKWFFYAFYPVHIFLLYLVACAMGLGQVKLM